MIKISNDQFNIDLEITNIYTENDKVFISGQPQFKKVKSPLPSGEKSE